MLKRKIPPVKPMAKQKWQRGSAITGEGARTVRLTHFLDPVFDPVAVVDGSQQTKTLEFENKAPDRGIRIPIGILAGIRLAGGGFLLESLREHGAGASFWRPKPARKQGNILLSGWEQVLLA